MSDENGATKVAAALRAQADGMAHSRDVLWRAAELLELANEEIGSMSSYIDYLLDHGFTWGEDGMFAFPDGMVWRKKELLEAPVVVVTSSGPSEHGAP